MKQDYLEQSAQMQMMQIKYQSTCKELENFETTFKQHLEQSLKDEKPKRRTRKHKVTEDSDSTSSNEDDESEEEAKMIEIKLNELSENDSEQAEISRLENVIKSNKNNIDNLRLEIEKLTTLNNVLRKELKQTHEEKANLNVFWQEKTKGMENTWARTEMLLKSEIVELQMRLKMFTEKKESDLTENALDLSIDKKNISEIELKEQSDSESFENIDDIFEEMRLRHLISPMPLFDEDQIYIDNCSTDQIPPSLSLTETIPDINERNLSLLESPSKSKYTDRRKTLPDGPKNVLEVNKMLLEKARQLNATSFSPTGDVEEINKSNEIEKDSDNGIPVDSVSANASASESISELSFSIFDSCYETLESNPPSIEMASINVVAVEKQFSSEQKLIRSNESDQVEEAKNIPNEDIPESSHSRMSSATGIKTDYYYNLDNNIETESVFHSENKTSSSINGDSSLQNIENEMQLFDDDLRASLIDFCVFPLQESHESDFKPINSTQEMYLQLQKDEIGIGENKIETDITSHIKEQEHTNNLLHNDLENKKTAKIEIGLTNSPNLTNSNSSEMDFEDFTSMNDGDDTRRINQSKSCSLDDFLDIRLSKSYVECEDNFSRRESELERKKIKVEINNSLKTFDESLKVSSIEDTKEDTLNVCNQAQNDTESPEKPTNKTEIKQIPPKTHFEEFEKEQANTNQSLVCKSHLKNFKTVKLMKRRVLSSGNDSEEIETVKKVLRNGKLVQTKIKKYSLKS
ncbi:hypothetical protein HHI36_020842 [Cryptolaemus montrouzieri]|uniref:Uncharacterized protein n=1 Tax=Cryptolaemus montrouzieri TaxID=559131 RepID=A0ABD2NBX2_9CUCU